VRDQGGSVRFAFVAVVLAGLNLRMVFASLPPLLDRIRADLHLGAGVAGLLTTGPLLCFGTFALLAPRLARRIAIERLLVIGLGLTAIGTAVRGTGGVVGLFAGTLAAGVAVAITQAVLPILIRTRHGGRAGVLTGAYTMALTLGSAFAAGTVVPFAHAFGGWRGALAVYALPAAAAAVLWLPLARGEPTIVARPPSLDLHRLRGSWSLALYFGLQSMAFYAGLTWLPSILEAHGYSEGSAGTLQAVANAVQFVPAFLIPVLAGRRPHQTEILVVLVVLGVVAATGLLVAPSVAAVWMVMLGLVQGGALGLAMILPVLRGGSGPAVAALTGMALSVGYLIASIGPFVLGVVHDATGGWTVPLLLFIAITAAELPVGIRATRPWQVD
jgi:CP family cyanate transporter-like MFS transporter